MIENKNLIIAHHNLPTHFHLAVVFGTVTCKIIKIKLNKKDSEQANDFRRKEKMHFI